MSDIALRTRDARRHWAAPGGRRVLLPIYFADVSKRRGWVRVRALLAPQFADVPGLANPDQITAREEDRVNAYYASGPLFSQGTNGGLPAPQATVGAGL